MQAATIADGCEHRNARRGQGENEAAGPHGEVPLYVVDTPANPAVAASAGALDVGMGQGTRKSGFFPEQHRDQRGDGVYSLWLKADTLADPHYIVAFLPLVDGPLLKGQSGTQITLLIQG